MEDKQKQTLRAWLEREQEIDYDTLAKEINNPENEELKSVLSQLNALDDLSDNQEKMWHRIQQQTKPVARYSFARYLKYTAILILLSYGAWTSWQMFGRKTHQEEKMPQITSLEPGAQKAYLIIGGEEQVELRASLADTTITGEGFQVKVDSGGSISYATNAPSSLDKENTLITPRAGEYKVVLSDGSVVWLNSESALTYPVVFSRNNRTVHLKGEGYFNVARDEKRPFRVVIDQEFTVNVLGTVFNINAYRDRGDVVTTLISGKVEIMDKNEKSLSTLHPGQQAVFREGQSFVQNVDPDQAISWLNGKFYFESMPLLNIMQQLQRWYNIDFTFASEDLKNFEFTGVIRRDNTAEEIFKIIEKTIWVKFKVTDRNVVISY